MADMSVLQEMLILIAASVAAFLGGLLHPSQMGGSAWEEDERRRHLTEDPDYYKPGHKGGPRNLNGRPDCRISPLKQLHEGR